jgi:hypothetical protein
MIDASAFAYCTNLTSITIPASVKNIQRFFLAGCTSLTSITVEEGSDSFVSVDGVLFNKEMTWLAAFPAGRPGNFSYDIPESVEHIGDDAFYECAGLTSVTIPAGVKDIGTCAFWACSALTSVAIPHGVTSIYMRAFEDCASLTSVVIPASVVYFGSSVFGNCRNLFEVVNAAKEPTTIYGDLFQGVDLSLCKLLVQSGSEVDYRSAFVWQDFGEIWILKPGLKLDKTEVYLLPGATTEIKATITVGLNSDEIGWISNRADIADVDLAGKVTAIKAGTTDIFAFSYGTDAVCKLTVIAQGHSSIEGTVDNAGTSNLRVNLYMKPPDTDTKKGIIGGYVLLATVIPNDDGGYSFENLPEGEYQVEVVLDDDESEASDEFPVSGNEIVTEVNFTIDDEGEIIAGEVIVHPVVTGAVETWHAASVQIYPNPFTDAVRITGVSAVETWHAASLQIQVINTTGAIVHTQTIASPDETIHLGHLPAGMYFIRLKNSKTVKVIKIL